MSTIVMRVDLDCDKCCKKIRKVLCKLQDRENIKTISYDEKSNTVTVSGSFDAEEVSHRLRSGAGKVITDMQVARGNQMMPGAKAAPKHPGKDSHGQKHEGHGHAHGGQQAHGYGGGGQQAHGHGGQQAHGYGGGGQQAHGHGGGGGKPDKTKHVKFEMDDEGIDQHAHHGNKGHGNDHGSKANGHAHGHGHGEKPRVFTTTAMSRNEAPRPQQPASMAAMAPMRMPGPGPGPSMAMMPQAMSAPSIWPPPPRAPEWGYSAPAYGYGGGPPAGGYYGVPVYDHGGYAAYGGGGYGKNPYQLPQYYEEEPSAGCSVM